MLPIPQSVLKGTGHGALPPMLEQYVQLRDAHPDYLLLFQCGDFYETFGEDAERAARLMGLHLTHKSSKDFSTPMAGLPIRAADAHIEKLLSQGVRVAVADQMEEPSSGLVDRKVTQLLTPGTVTEERLLSADENFLAAVATGDGYALALLDLSTGEFRCAAFGTRAALYDDLSRWRAREVLLAPELSGNAALLADFQGRFPVMLSQASFDEDAARQELTLTLGDLPASLSSSALIRACGAVLAYARSTQQGRLEMVRRLSRYEPGAQLRLNDWALRALEVFAPQTVSSAPGAESTLIGALSETRSAGGRRRLRAWLRSPLRDGVSISARQGAVASLLAAPDIRHGVRALLYRAHDLERLSARVATRRAGPREVAALARTLELLPDAAALLEGQDGLLANLRNRLGGLPEVVALIRAALVDEPPIRSGEGGLIREGFHSHLDGLRGESLGHRAWIAELELSERIRSGIPNLKVGYNSVFGYYLEVSSSHLSKVPADYRQVATLKDRSRFTRPDLREHEREIARLDGAADRLEAEVYTELREQLSQHAEALSEAAGAVSELDVLASLAEIAAERGWVRPVTTEGALHLRQARHPVVERSVGGGFVPNDAELHAERRTLIITGPNMAGKSTYLRTVALCALLHQIGSFVPADAAELPLFDAIHTRIGASDDLAGGRSTFMVEMSELADILHGATRQSLVILDEVGRGTSTLDGQAIAQAALEGLHATGAYTLFATHYFELTRLEGQLPGLLNLHVAAEEDSQLSGGGLTFYHQVMPGAAAQSYGVEVARLAGLPQGVTARAASLLAGLNAQGDDGALSRELAALDLGRVTPMGALELLQKWQRAARGEG
ncbi:DNA mismatch repair protein MutS [Deinococcus radiomollis]|uniref:DNA mismatch repair protein MutS n=1 Tax=Deinococcus radiomollis TaxID=468916 RepID=UPI003892C0CF